MKIYRCVIGVLLVFFITLAVLYITSVYDEQRSIEEGILIMHDKEVPCSVWDKLCEECIKGGECIVTGHSLC